MHLFRLKSSEQQLKRMLGLMSVSSLLFFSSCTQPMAGIRGTLTGVESDTLLVFMDYMHSRKHFRTDTVALHDNNFNITLPDTALYINILAKPALPNGALRMAVGRPILYFPGDHLKVVGEWDNKKVLGSALYNELAEHQSILALQEEINSLNEAFTLAYQSQDKSKQNDIRQKVAARYNEIQQAKFDIIKHNPNTVSAAYYATEMKPELGLDAISLLSEEVKSGPMSILIKDAKVRYENSLARAKAKKYIKKGNMAPNFNLKTLEGKDVSLATFHGKYLLLDFWGSWCGWCIKGFPEMKKYYAKYSKKIEFLGVCCNDTDVKWRKAVETHKLPWVNAIEGDAKLSVKYAVSGFPTKILINPEGQIEKVFVGESSELYHYLDSIFKK